MVMDRTMSTFYQTNATKPTVERTIREPMDAHAAWAVFVQVSFVKVHLEETRRIVVSLITTSTSLADWICRPTLLVNFVRGWQFLL